MLQGPLMPWHVPVCGVINLRNRSGVNCDFDIIQSVLPLSSTAVPLMLTCSFDAEYLTMSCEWSMVDAL